MGYSIKRRMNRFHRIRGIISRLMNETVGANRAEGNGVSDHARNVIPGTSPASSTIKAGREFIDEPLPFFFAEVDRPSFLENPVKTDSAKGYHAANFKQCDYRAVGEVRVDGVWRQFRYRVYYCTPHAAGPLSGGTIVQPVHGFHELPENKPRHTAGKNKIRNDRCTRLLATTADSRNYRKGIRCEGDFVQWRETGFDGA